MQTIKDLFSTYYQGIILLCAALVAELVICNGRRKAAVNKKAAPSVVSEIISSALILAAYLLAALVIGALFEKPTSLDDFIYLVKTMIGLDLSKLFVLIIFVPLVVWCARLFSNKSTSVSLPLIVVTLVLLAVGPFLKGKTTSDEILKDTALEGCRATSLPMTTRFFDDEDLFRRFVVGYTEDDKDVNISSYLERPVNPNGGSEVAEAEIGADGDLLSTNEAKYYLEEVSSVYKKSPESLEGTYDLGMMWYYKGFKDKKAGYFNRGAEAFMGMGQTHGAIICYYNSIRLKPDKEIILKVSDIILDASKDQLKLCRYTLGRLMLLLQNTYPDDFPAMKRLHELYPKNFGIQIVWLTRQLGKWESTEGCADVLSYFLSNEKFASCPKFLIAQAYMTIRSGESYNTKTLFNLYRKHPEYFEPEDLIHLSWIFYNNGNNDRAFDLAAAGYAATSSLKMKADKAAALGTSLLLPAELSILIPEHDTLVSPLKMYSMISATTGEGAVWFSERVAGRNEVISLLLADKLGKRTAMSDLAEKGMAVFAGERISDRIFAARVSQLTGENEAALDTCDELLGVDSLSTADKNKIRLTMADALLELANFSGYDKQTCYEEALEAVLAVRKSGQQYIECVNRLKEIYGLLKDTYPEEAEEMKRLAEAFA